MNICVALAPVPQFMACAGQGANCTFNGQPGKCMEAEGLGFCLPDTFATAVPVAFGCDTTGAPCTVMGRAGNCTEVPPRAYF